jgi:hypothetical protein
MTEDDDACMDQIKKELRLEFNIANMEPVQIYLGAEFLHIRQGITIHKKEYHTSRTGSTHGC